MKENQIEEEDDTDAGEPFKQNSSKGKKNRKVGFVGRWTKLSVIGVMKTSRSFNPAKLSLFVNGVQSRVDAG
ncbi:hypothetical protein PI126_g18037 [Phytophthora idaei]|nr:hypothetical protein PI126_g18037 [Phytophthora idaei]